MTRPLLRGWLPELDEIARLTQAATDVGGSVEVIAEPAGAPIHAFRFGSADRSTPALFVLGGVHGIERIGTEVAIAYLASFVTRLGWDAIVQRALASCRLVIVPLLNPVGMMLRRRANGSGVDLMRNAPASAAGPSTLLVGGQRLSRHLPWYMGAPGAPMEPEAAALARLVEAELFAAPLAIALDVHSGFGFVDRLWYPYARTREAPPDLPAIDALVRLLDDTLPNHVYRVEQTSRAYTIRGDLWDHLYDLRRAAPAPGRLLSLTLEMGSWTWVRKNPLQGFSRLGRFNPVKPHRRRRTLRRHLPLLDFLLHAVASHEAWLPISR